MSVYIAKSDPVLLQIQQLLVPMQQAMVAGKWLQVQNYDRQISDLVMQLKLAGTEQQFKKELTQLKQRYQALVELAKRQQQQLEHKMQNFQDIKPAVLAYQLTKESHN